MCYLGNFTESSLTDINETIVKSQFGTRPVSTVEQIRNWNHLYFRSLKFNTTNVLSPLYIVLVYLGYSKLIYATICTNSSKINICMPYISQTTM